MANILVKLQHACIEQGVCVCVCVCEKNNLKATFQFESILQRGGVDRLSVWQHMKRASFSTESQALSRQSKWNF